MQRQLHEQVTRQYGRQTDLIYYDVTNYYFSIDRQDDLRRKGPSKENKKSPIVQMGLMLDKNSLPISYKVFPGNRHDSQTLMPMLTEVKKTYDVERITETLQKVPCSHLSQNLWLFDYADEITDDINAAFGRDFGKKNITLQSIKNNLGQAKKG